MKRILTSILLLTLSITLIVIINTAQVIGKEETKENEGPPIAVTTTFLYDMVQVLEEDVDYFNVNLIIPPGEDPHVYSPTASDLRMLTEAEFVLYQGLDFEGRMMTLLEHGIAVADDLDADDLEEMEDEGDLIIDPHFWFSIELYKEAVMNTKDVLKEQNPDGSAQYEDNLNAYFEELDALDEYIVTELERIPEERRILITPHDAFGYMGRAYDIEVHAPQGFSTESEVSNREINDIAQLIVDNEVPAIFIETTTNPNRMQRLQEIVESAGHDVEVVSDRESALLSDSLAAEGEKGDNYLDMYKRNIDIIVQHLSQGSDTD